MRELKALSGIKFWTFVQFDMAQPLAPIPNYSNRKLYGSLQMHNKLKNSIFTLVTKDMFWANKYVKNVFRFY